MTEESRPETRSTDPSSTDPSSTDPTEELAMDPDTPGRSRLDSTPSTSRAADDAAPWSAPTGTTPSGATARATTTPESARGPRVRTVVWGVVVIVAGALLAAAAAGAVLDVQLAVIVTVALAGVALVVGSLVSAGRRRTRDA